MRYPEGVSGLHDAEQQVLHEHALAADFDTAAHLFDVLLADIDSRQSQADETEGLALGVLRAVTLRDRAFTRLRRTVHSGEYDSDALLAADNGLQESLDQTAELRGAGDAPGRTEHHWLSAEHGMTMSCRARLAAAHFTGGVILAGRGGLSSQPARDEVAARYGAAHVYLLNGDSAYGGASNAIRAAMFDRSIGGTSEMSPWLRRSVNFVVDKRTAYDVEDRRQAARTVARHILPVLSRGHAIDRMTDWLRI